MSATDPGPVLPPARTSTKTIVIASIVVLVAFVSGAFTGILVDHLLHRGRRPPHMRGMTHTMAAHLDRRLELTDAQREKIEEILRRRHQRMWELSESVRPQIHKEIEATNAEIERVLTPAQREKFQEMKMRMRFGHGRHREGKRRRESTR